MRSPSFPACLLWFLLLHMRRFSVHPSHSYHRLPSAASRSRDTVHLNFLSILLLRKRSWSYCRLCHHRHTSPQSYSRFSSAVLTKLRSLLPDKIPVQHSFRHLNHRSPRSLFLPLHINRHWSLTVSHSRLHFRNNTIQ